MLGLLVGFVLRFPTNWILVMIGWKHGMGSKEGAMKVQSMPAKAAWLTTMVALGGAALLLPSWLTVVRQHVLIRDDEAAITPAQHSDVGEEL